MAGGGVSSPKKNIVAHFKITFLHSSVQNADHSVVIIYAAEIQLHPRQIMHSATGKVSRQSPEDWLTAAPNVAGCAAIVAAERRLFSSA